MSCARRVPLARPLPDRVALACAMLFLATYGTASASSHSAIALLVAAPWPGETAMAADVVAMEALRGRGLTEFRLLRGPATRKELLDFFESAGQRIAQRQPTQVFLHYSGHGTFAGRTVDDARVGLAPSATERDYGRVLWSEVLAALKLPSDTTLILLPDS